MITAAAALADLGRTRAQFDARAADIQTALAEGAETLTVEIITSDSPYNCFSMSWELEPDAGIGKMSPRPTIGAWMPSGESRLSTPETKE